MAKKEFNFHNHPWESFLFIDIETVSVVPELEEDTPLYDSFKYKMRYAEEAQRKDFNVNYIKALFAEKAALYPEFGKIVAITVGRIVQGNKIKLYTYKDEDEKTLLTRFNKHVAHWAAEDPNIALCGVNIKFFDLRYLFVRSIVNQVEPVKGHIDFSGMKPWEVNVADITDIWKQTSPYNAPLICMAECLGLPSPKSDIDGSEVSATYWKEDKPGLDRIAQYCERDVLTTANIARRLRLEPLLEVYQEEEGVEASEPELSELPPLLQKTFNVGHLTPEDEETLIKKSRKSSALEKKRLADILQAIYGKKELDEELISKITK